MKGQHVYFGTAALVVAAVILATGYGLGRASRSEEDVARATRRTIYVIHEFSWRWRNNRAPVVLDDGRPGTPVMAFVDRDRADAHCQQLNLQKRARSNPFRHTPEGGEYTSMSEAAFLALIRAEGLTPPANFPSAGEDDLAWAWSDWWEEHVREWDDRLFARLWGALDRVSFYEVRETTLEP